MPSPAVLLLFMATLGTLLMLLVPAPIDWPWVIGMAIILLNSLSLRYAFPWRDSYKAAITIYFSLLGVGVALSVIYPLIRHLIK